MIIKLIKFVFFLSVIGVVIYCLVGLPSFHNQHSTDIGDLATRGESIQYKRRLKNGTLTIIASHAEMKSANCIILKDVQAILKRDSKITTISSPICEIVPKKRQAYLKKDVHMRTADTMCQTDSVVIDFKKNTISGKSKLHGTKAGMKFVAQEFFIAENGKIVLKHARMLKTIKKTGVRSRS
ncbi:MAG: hypothetical protein LBF56_04045 [Holosporales bacterium]|jgi:hypothetical protein|nr:hypothetical protein [Holosporales bacterium]